MDISGKQANAFPRKHRTIIFMLQQSPTLYSVDCWKQPFYRVHYTRCRCCISSLPFSIAQYYCNCRLGI